MLVGLTLIPLTRGAQEAFPIPLDSLGNGALVGLDDP